MTWFPEADIYLNSTTVGGLPTCTFSPKPYARRITNIVVGNTVNSGVKCYRGALGSTPVAQNLLGSNNTLKGPISVPAGQLFFVQWDTAGSAFARVSWERSDNPLEHADISFSSEWATDAVTSISVPNTGDPSLRIGTQIPAEIFTFYAPDLPIAMIQARQGSGDYIAFVLVDPVLGRSFVDVIGRESVGATLSVANRWRMGTIGVDTSLTVLSNAFAALTSFEIDVGAPFIIDAVEQGRGLIDFVEDTADTGLITVEAVTLNGATKTYRDGRAFGFWLSGFYSQSVAGQASLRIRQSGASGTLLCLKRTPVLPTTTATSAAYDYFGVFRNTKGSDVVDDVVATGQSSAGNLVVGASATAPRFLRIWDCGLATDYPGMPSLT